MALEIINTWAEAFNNSDIETLSGLYHDDAEIHNVPHLHLKGKTAIRENFGETFSKAKMVCRIDNCFSDEEWVIIEWKELLSIRGCSFFKIKDNKIIFQRNYCDRLAVMQAYHLPMEISVNL